MEHIKRFLLVMFRICALCAIALPYKCIAQMNEFYPEFITVVYKNKTTEKLNFRDYCVSVAHHEFDPPSWFTYNEEKEFACIAVFSAALYANIASNHGKKPIGVETTQQVPTMEDEKVKILSKTIYSSWYSAFDIVTQWRLTENGYPFSGNYASETNDIGPDNSYKDNRQNFGRYGDGHFHASYGGKDGVSNYRIAYSALGHSNYGIAAPATISQKESARLVSGKIGNSGTTFLPAKFNGQVYCKLTWLEVFAYYYFNRNLILEHQNGQSEPLNNYYNNCKGVEPTEGFHSPNMDKYRWSDQDHFVSVNITKPITGTTIQGYDFVKEYALGKGVQFDGHERLFKFTAPKDGKYEWIVRDKSSAKKLKVFLTQYPGPWWPNTVNWVSRNSDYTGKPDTFYSDLKSGREYYFYVDSPDGKEGEFEINVTCPNGYVTGSSNAFVSSNELGALYNPNAFDTERNTLQGTTKAHTTNYTKNESAMPWEFSYLGFDVETSGKTYGSIKSAGQENWYKIVCTYPGRATIKVLGMQKSLRYQLGNQFISEEFVSNGSSVEAIAEIGTMNLFIKVSGTIGNYALLVDWVPENGELGCSFNAGAITKQVQGCRAELSINPKEGTPPYLFLWSQGVMSTYNFGFVLEDGTYSCTVLDSKGCFSVRTVGVSGIGANTMTAKTTVTATDNCKTNKKEGVVKVDVKNGGKGMYVYDWSDGNTLVSEKSSYSRKNISAGIYSVTITGPTSCSTIIDNISTIGKHCADGLIVPENRGCGITALTVQSSKQIARCEWKIYPFSMDPYFNGVFFDDQVFWKLWSPVDDAANYKVQLPDYEFSPFDFRPNTTYGVTCYPIGVKTYNVANITYTDGSKQTATYTTNESQLLKANLNVAISDYFSRPYGYKDVMMGSPVTDTIDCTDGRIGFYAPQFDDFYGVDFLTGEFAMNSEIAINQESGDYPNAGKNRVTHIISLPDETCIFDDEVTLFAKTIHQSIPETTQFDYNDPAPVPPATAHCHEVTLGTNLLTFKTNYNNYWDADQYWALYPDSAVIIGQDTNCYHHGYDNMISVVPGHYKALVYPFGKVTPNTYAAACNKPILGFYTVEQGSSLYSSDTGVPVTEEIKLYPNPTTGEITIYGPAGRYYVTDILGTTLCEFTVAGTTQLDVSRYPAGIYFVRAQNRQARITRFVKE